MRNRLHKYNNPLPNIDSSPHSIEYYRQLTIYIEYQILIQLWYADVCSCSKSFLNESLDQGSQCSQRTRCNSSGDMIFVAFNAIRFDANVIMGSLDTTQSDTTRRRGTCYLLVSYGHRDEENGRMQLVMINVMQLARGTMRCGGTEHL